MFRILIYPLSGACIYSLELPHGSYGSWFDVFWGFDVFGLERYPYCSLQHGYQSNPTTTSTCNTDSTPNQPNRNPNTHRTKKNMTNVVIQQTSRQPLMMDILMSETCWAHKKWNKIASDIKLFFYSSTKQIIIYPHIKPLCIKLCTQHFIIWQTLLLKESEGEILWMCEVTCDEFIAHRINFMQIIN